MRVDNASLNDSLNGPPMIVAGIFITIAAVSAIVAIFAAIYPHSSVLDATAAYAMKGGVSLTATNFVVAKYAAIVTASSLGVLLVGGITMLAINKIRKS